jgi:hypothetical protein
MTARHDLCSSVSRPFSLRVQEVIDDNKAGLKECMKQRLPNVPKEMYRDVMAEAYRWMCDSVHSSHTAIEQREQACQVYRVPAGSSYDYGKKVDNDMKEIDGDAMAEILACMYQTMSFKAKIVRNDWDQWEEVMSSLVSIVRDWHTALMHVCAFVT